MSNFQRNNRFECGFAARKSLHTLTLAPIALAFVGLFSGKGFADDGPLRFERLSAKDARSLEAVPARAPRAAVGASAAGVPAAPAVASSGGEVLRFDRASPAQVPQRTARPTAVGSRATASSQGAPRPAAASAGSASGRATAPAVPGVSAVAYGLVGGLDKPAAVAGSETELREIFLRAVQDAAERSPNVRRALAEQSASQSDIDEARGQRLPQIDIGTRSKSMEFGSGSRGNASGQSVSVDVVTPVFDWGRIRKTIQSRTYLANAADSALQAELEASAFDVTSNLIELGKQRIVVDISQKFVDRMAELVKMLEGIVAVDTGRVSELTQARARLLQAEASRSTAESKVRDIEINLHKMIGEKPLPPLPRAAYWGLRQPQMDWLLAESANHPVVLQSQAQAKSADLQADVVRSSALPQVNWVVGKTTGEDAYGREPAWQTSLSLSWSAFRGGSTRAAERAARQRAEASRQSTEQQILDLEYRIRAANHDAQTLLERAELYRGLSVESDKVRQAFYEQWYHLGRRTLLDVLISESDHFNNQVSEIASRFDGYAAIIRQYASSGVLLRWLGGVQ
jgi:adhesin transport system outer membrane protein